MMSAELVRAALGSADPAGELDRLVRGQLAAGRTTAQLYDELLPVARLIRKETPLPEDADEVLLGTLDALIGHCNPDECYYDLPDGLPTEDEIAKLPRWALVAFEARCARRVLPLFAQSWPDAPEFHLGTVANDVEVAELAAATAKPAARRGDWDSVVTALTASRAGATVAPAVARAAARAAEAAADAESPYRLPPDDLQAIEAAAAALPESIPRIRGDYERIARLAAEHGWTDQTPVPPSAFGPLWPDGVPSGWPVIPPTQPNAVAVEPQLVPLPVNP